MASAQDKVTATEPFVIPTLPGIKRDGTRLDGEYFVDGAWVRFQRGRARKMAGMRLLNHELSGPVRLLNMFGRNGLNYLHSGSAEALEQLTIALGGGTSSPQNRTPAGFAGDAANLWTMDVMFDVTSGLNQLLAHAAPNMVIDQITETPLYTGDITAGGALTDTGDANAVASGGVVVLHPYAFLFGTDGVVKWSVANKPNDFTNAGSGTARITGQKIITGRKTRGGNAPAGLFWSLDGLIRALFVGGSAVWQFTDIDGESSIMGQNTIVPYNGQFFWIGTDRFLMYNGAVQDVPNDFNANYFFDNVNFAYRQKVFGFKVPRYREIWWLYPRGSATECTHYIVLNMEGGRDPRTWYWYDGPLTRSSAFYSQVFPYPIMTDLTPNANDKYGLYQHEFGTDLVDAAGNALAIRSFIETGDISAILGNRGKNEPLRNRNTRLADIGIELDLVQSEQMRLTVTGGAYPRSEDVTNDYDFLPTTKFIALNEQRAYMRLRFESNVAGGNYQMGQNVLHLGQGDRNRGERPT